MNSRKLPFNSFKILFVLASLVYPLIVYWGIQRGGFAWLFPLLAIGVAKLLTLKDAKRSRTDFVMPIALLSLALLTLLLNKKELMLYYPLVINLVFLVVFASSLFRERSFVETLARLREPDLPPQGVTYTWWVTLVWSTYFVINSLVVLYSIKFASTQFWALYNGLISYLIMGALFAGEFLLRHLIRKNWNENAPS